MKKIFFFLFSIITACAIAQPTYTSQWGSAITTGNYNAASNTIVRSLITNNATNGSAGLFINNGAQTLRLFMSIDSGYITSSRPVVLPENLFFKSTGNTGDVLTRAAGGKVEWQTPLKYIDSLYRKANKDSIFYRKNNIEYAIKDSVGSGGSAAGITAMVQFNNAAAFAADSNFIWDNTNKRLGLREFTPAATLDIRSSSNTSLSDALRVGGSSNNNYLRVRGDGVVSFNSTPAAIGDYRFSSLSQDASLFFESTVSNTIILRSRANTNTAINRNIDIIGNEVGLSQAGDRALTVRNSGGGGGFTETVVQGNVSTAGLSNLLIIRNPGNLHGTSRVLFQRNTQNYGAIDGRSFAVGTDNYIAISAQNSAQTSLNEVIRFIGNGNVLIGSTTDVASSILTLQSSTKGILLPRLTTTQINAITSPATGLTVYNTTENTLCFFNGSTWQKVTSTNL